MLGDFEQLVLAGVLANGTNAYGATIHETVEELAGKWRVVSMGAVYTTLDRLEEKGMLASSYGDPTPERGGRPKRYFRITAKGQTAINQVRETAERMLAVLATERGPR